MSRVDLLNPDISDASMQYIELTVGADKINLMIMVSLDMIEAGHFDESVQHFLDTLSFKGVVAVRVRPADTTYVPYDSVFFSVEYPRSWQTHKTQAESVGSTMYIFADRSFDTAVGVSFGTMSELGQKLDFASVYVTVPSASVASGRFDEPVLHFLDSLTFKM